MEKKEESKPKESKENKKEELVINPNEFQNNSGGEIDYFKIIKMFGCKHVDAPLLERIEKLTGHKPHHFLKRNIFFAYR